MGGDRGYFRKMKAASGRDTKGHFFPKKTIKRHLTLIRTTPMLIAFLHCF